MIKHDSGTPQSVDLYSDKCKTVALTAERQSPPIFLLFRGATVMKCLMPNTMCIKVKRWGLCSIWIERILAAFVPLV